MHGDHRAVLIAGYASGSESGSSLTSIVINGIEFTATISLNLATLGSHGAIPPMETCQLLIAEIAAYTTGLGPVPEFETDCLSLPGDAILLLVQANSKKFPIPTEKDDETQAWVKAKRRYLHMNVMTSDSTQTVLIIK